ncbi:5,10-methylenetetrahydrofolate reductase [Candidatus Bathyarchaeota archaeon]|nr:MAG: 5,10-methylenetetrahydrofolate reductase [Candidatus Bathyarchaeota archaeon]
MIITQQKPFEEVLEMLKPFRKIFVMGCGTCATTCQTGGEEQVKEMAEKLKNEGKEITGTVVVESPCDARLLRRDTRKVRSEIESAEVILCMACGAGVQTVVEHIKKITVPCLDTKFIGETERIGRFYEMCRACGECILFETGGICPVTRCPKSMMNGPCGGMYDGKCEVGGYKRDCAWVLIYNRLKELGMLDLYKSFKPPRDYRKLSIEPREVVWV